MVLANTTHDKYLRLNKILGYITADKHLGCKYSIRQYNS